MAGRTRSTSSYPSTTDTASSPPLTTSTASTPPPLPITTPSSTETPESSPATLASFTTTDTEITASSSTTNTFESPYTTGASLTTSPTTVALSTTSPQSSVEPSSSSSAAAAASITSGDTTSSFTSSSTSNVNAGAIAGGAIGGAVALVLLILGLILCRRARSRKHIAPSSEFAETIKRGELPVLRLDCGVEIVPSASRHHVPLPPRQDSYYTSPALSDMKLPDGIGGSDEQSVRYSLEKPLQPLRYPGFQGSNESMTMGNAARRVSSIGSSQEFWSRDAGKFDIRKDYRSISPLPIDTNYTPLMQNTYPMEPSRAVDTLQDSYADLWKLSVAPMTRTQQDSVRNGADTQPLPPLRPVRRSVDVGSGRKV